MRWWEQVGQITCATNLSAGILHSLTVWQNPQRHFFHDHFRLMFICGSNLTCMWTIPYSICRQLISVSQHSFRPQVSTHQFAYWPLLVFLFLQLVWWLRRCLPSWQVWRMRCLSRAGMKRTACSRTTRVRRLALWLIDHEMVEKVTCRFILGRRRCPIRPSTFQVAGMSRSIKTRMLMTSVQQFLSVIHSLRLQFHDYTVHSSLVVHKYNGNFRIETNSGLFSFVYVVR